MFRGKESGDVCCLLDLCGVQGDGSLKNKDRPAGSLKGHVSRLKPQTIELTSWEVKKSK